MSLNDLKIYKNKTVLVTGHTGFKGSWLSLWLERLGAHVVGYALPSWDNDRLFRHCKPHQKIKDHRGNICDFSTFQKTVKRYKPCVIFHLAAQPLVRDSYERPLDTFDTNVMGTLSVLESARLNTFIKSVLIVTTDKCYLNDNRKAPYHENDRLGGHDPYSASKAAAEIVAESYRRSYFSTKGPWIATARAGNIIGGGDYSKDRLMPDILRALAHKKTIAIRNPHSTRPWQHVLDPLYGYLLLTAKLLKGESQYAQAWNFGPNQSSIVSVGELTQMTISAWGSGDWKSTGNVNAPYESKILSLDIRKAKKHLGWSAQWNLKKSIEKTVAWQKALSSKGAYHLCVDQIDDYNRELL